MAFRRLTYLSMRLRFTLLTFLFLQIFVPIFSQCPPPGFPNSGDNCGSPIICENLDGYCNTINNNNQSRAFPCCNNFTLNNDEWFGFFAGTTSITIDITPSNCTPGTNGALGLQAAIYAACPPNNPSNNWCNTNLMDAQCSCDQNTFTLSSNNFVVGQVYWFVFDGCSGSVCDYSVDVTSGQTTPFPPDAPGDVTGPTPICQGTTGAYSLPTVNGASTYTWTISPSAAGTVSGSGNSINVNWASGWSGTAQLCVKVSNACFQGDTSCHTVEVLPKPTATISGGGVICNGSGGSVNLTVTFTGDAPWEFVYSIGGVNQPAIQTSNNPYTITATQPGTYKLVSVKSVDSEPDCNGTVSGTSTVTEVTINPTATTVKAVCGQNNGSVDLSHTGGNSPFTYSWSGGQTTQDLSNVGPGTYTVTVTDANGCTKTLTASVGDVITPPTIASTVTNNTTCINGNGAIDLTITPATNNTFIWSGGQTTEDLSSLVPGTYTVTVTQGVTCSATASFTVADNPSLPSPTAVAVGAFCNLPNGSVNATITGGVSPYTFSWSNGATTEDLSNTLPGDYTLTVTGANGCTKTVSATVSNTDPKIVLSATTQPNTSCNSGTGSIDLMPTPAAPQAPLSGYTYSWSNGSTVQDPTALPPGTYTVTVSAGGTCTETGSYTVADNPNRPVPTSTSVVSTCNLDNGSIDASVTGGVAPYTYAWSNGATTQDLSNIGPGNYTLTVTGANGCTQTLTASVANTDPQFTLTAATQPNTTCIGGNGSLDLSPSPAVPPAPLSGYTYSWSNGATTQDLSNLPPGDYTVTVSSGGTCTKVATFNVADNPSIPSPSATSVQSTCDLPNGSIDASVTGGATPYTYAWSNGATTQDLSNILAGTYILTVTGSNGCTRVLSVTVGNNNPPINLTNSVTANNLCVGGNGAIDLTASPSNPPSYTYTWSNGATTQDISGLTPGNYTVTVSAGGSCTAVSTINVPDGPNLPTPTATSVQSTCNLANGSIDASVTGGAPPYTYAWSNGATTQDLSNILSGPYTLTVTAANGCTRTLTIDVGNNNPPINLSTVIVNNTTCSGGNGSIDLTASPAGPTYTYTWSNGATTQDINNLTPGTYVVTVSAGGTCTQTGSYTVADNPNLPNPTATFVQTTCSFANGSIDASVTGGVSPYTYSWSNGATTQDLSNILAGTYTLTVTGANGCTKTITVDVTNTNPPINVTATAMPNTVCNASPNGSIDVSVSPANPNYTYTWSNGATTQDLTGVATGSYTVTVSAGGTCTQVATFDVPNNPNSPQINSSVVNTSCGFSNGSINIIINGGPTPYTYLWNPGGVTTQNLSMIPAGDYQVTVTAANGCTVAANITVANVNPPINLSASILPNTTCNNSPNGNINLSVAPLGPAYTYTWSNGATTQDLSNLPAGDYSVTVSAGGTCTEVASFNVEFLPNEPFLSAFTVDANCGLPNGQVNLNVSNGVPPYTYAWSSGQTTQNLTSITGGDYVVVVTGANGCTAQLQVIVANNDIPIDVDANVVGKTSCITNNGSISLTVSPFNASLIWSNGSTTKSLSGLSPGDYTVTVSMGGTCTTSVTYTIEDETEKPVITAEIMPAVCSYNNGSVDLTVDYGIPPYTYDWAHIPGANNFEDLVNLSAGNYAVTVTTSVGCTEVFFAAIDNDILQVEINGVVGDDYSCTTNNGSIDIDVTPPVNYIYDWAHIPGTSNIQNLSNLGAGTYSVTATFGTCKANASFDLIDATEPPSISISPTAATCGISNGAITLNVSGASAPYTFNWAHIPGTNDPQNLNNLPTGTYTVTVTDFFDCTATASTTVGSNNIALNISGVPTDNTSCAAPNGGLDISVTPAGNYNYLWSNAATTQDLTGIAPGIYGVTVSLGTSCSAQAALLVANHTVNPQLSPAVTAAICSQNNGNIQVTTTSGTVPYNFLWSNAATTEDLNNIFPGNYSLTVTDANGCTADTILNVANNASTFSLSGNASPYNNCATINGAVDLTVTPAGPYLYLWSNGETTQDLNNLPAGTYTVQVTEQGTCIASATYFVQDERTWPTLNQNVVPELCNLLDASVNISILNGGVAPFNYSWSSGQSTEDLNAIGGGTYTITVTGANNCSASLTANVPENDLPFSLTATAVPNSSCVILNGSVDLEITPAVPSGGPGYTYTWSGGFTTQDLNPVPAGTYAVTVSAGGTCTNTASYVVDDAAGAPSISNGISQALCGQSSGSINLTINGGASPYAFNWANGATTQDLNNIPSGPYAVTVTGSNGCQVTGSFNVPENTVIPNLAGIPQANTACVGPNGSINMGISPSSLNYTILWSNGATTQNLNNLTPGSYSVTVNGGGACIASDTYVVDNNTSAITAGGTHLDVLCFGNNTGAIDLMLTGGTQPFVFAWTPFLNGVEDPSALTAGNYTVTVTDAVGCTTSASFIINQPASPVQISCSALTTVSQPSAADGKAQVQISGGVAPYTVLWSPGGIQNGVSSGNFPLNNLGVGTYNVTVTDANGCTAICNFEILLTPCTSAVGTMGTAQLSHCSTGCITANYDPLGQILDPNDVLQFILHQGPDSLIVNEIARSSQPTFCFNPAKMTYGTTYYISAVVGNNDGSGNVVLAHYCTVIATGTPIVFYEKPVASIATPEPITCKTLQVNVLGLSSLPNGTFQWSTSNGNIVGAVNQANIEVDKAGNYTLIVNSPDGCLDTTSAAVLDIRNNPIAKILASPNDILDCVINEIILAGEVEGSTDANTVWYNQNGVLFPGGSVIKIDEPGTYWFAMVDTVTFCSDTASIQIGQDQLYPPLFINPPATLTCSIGNVTITGGSPISGIQFLWATISGQDTTILGSGTSLTVTQPNTYYLIGFDPVNGCHNILNAIVLTDQTYPVADAGQPFNIDCYGQTLTINGSASGGTGTLAYHWTTSGGVIVSGTNTLTPSISEPGVYTLLVTAQGNGCSDTDDVIVSPNEPEAIVTVNNPVCFGEKGSILVDTVLGAKPPIQYTLTPTTGSQSGNLFTNLAAGDYTIFVVDANGCATSVDETVVQPDVFEVTVNPEVSLDLGESYQVDATVNVPESEIANISWTPALWLSCDSCLSTRIDTPLHSQLYHILVVTKEGCKDDAPLLVRVNRQVHVYIPNIFSPNDDGNNDGFTVYADIRGVKQVKLFQIFDRWGDEVFTRENFQPNDPTLGWDGRFRGQDMNPAVFVYYAVVEFIDGQEVLFKGDVTVKR